MAWQGWEWYLEGCWYRVSFLKGIPVMQWTFAGKQWQKTIFAECGGWEEARKKSSFNQVGVEGNPRKEAEFGKQKQVRTEPYKLDWTYAIWRQGIKRTNLVVMFMTQQLSGWIASLAGELRLLFFFAGHDMLKLLSGTELNRIGLSD